MLSSFPRVFCFDSTTINSYSGEGCEYQIVAPFYEFWQKHVAFVAGEFHDHFSPCPMVSAQARAVLCGRLPLRERQELGGLNRNLALQKTRYGYDGDRLCGVNSLRRVRTELFSKSFNMSATCLPLEVQIGKEQRTGKRISKVGKRSGKQISKGGKRTGKQCSFWARLLSASCS